jgi:hypothetical protein
VKYPTRALLRSLRRKDLGEGFWLPNLTPKEAWRITEFLDEIQEAIWMDYGQAIAEYLDARDCHPPSRGATAGFAPATSAKQDDLEF